MNDIKINNYEGFVNDFLDEYLANGMGATSKPEIDILVMNLLMNYGSLGEKSNQDLSITLQATESKIKRLRYEARLKYPPDVDYVKREFLYVLGRSQFNSEKGKIIFIVEDEYLRHAIQGRLKAKGMYADSSFNTEIIKLDKNSLESIIEELYGKEIANDFHDGFNELDQIQENKKVTTFQKVILKFVLDTAKTLAIELFKSRLGI